jgi:hypothetical protein
VNFALAHPGRDMHWLLVHELLTTRKVRMLVLEVDEEEPRDLHPAFGSLADPADIVGAPLLINISYFSNLVRLPRRQLSLFLRSTLPDIFGSEMTFDPAWYRGAHWDDAWAEQGAPRAPLYPIRPRTTYPTETEMVRERAHEAVLAARKVHLPSSFAWLEQRANIYYLQKIAALAREHNTALNFLYLPGYQSLALPKQAAIYEQLGLLWTPPDFLSNRALWSDVNHLNYAGASSLAAWLGTSLSNTQEISRLPDDRHVSASAGQADRP